MSNEDKNFVEISSIILDRIRTLAVLTIVFSAVLIGFSFSLPMVFRAECKLVPATRFQNNGSLNVPNSMQNPSTLKKLDLRNFVDDVSRLYPQLIRNPDFSKNVLDHKFTNTDSHSNSLALHLDSSFDGSESAYRKLYGLLNRQILKIGIDERSGITTLGAESHDPQLAREIVDFCVNELDAAHRKILKTQSQQLIDFLEERQLSATTQLIDAESALTAFYQQNKLVQDDLTLKFKESRLLGEIELKNQVYQTLSLKMELAEIQVFRDIPTIQVLKAATTPMAPFKPNRPLIVVIALIFSFFLSFLIVIIQVGIQRFKQYNLESHE